MQDMSQPEKLNLATLDRVPSAIERPSYAREDLTAGIVHIGLGNFHRAHQSWYLHRLFQKGLSQDWAIIGAGVRPYDAAQRAKLEAQDYLTTLIELDPKGSRAEIVGPMIDYLPITEGNVDLIARMAQADIRIVALTVTEGGYYIDPVSKGFDASHPDMVHDAAHPDRPRTAFGAIIAALKLRRDTGIGPFTGMCCDNLQGNGAILRQTVVSLARMSDPELADWIDRECTFPNAMVDCIVPATGDAEISLARSMGVEDAVPVTHENFRQWVIEDQFCAGRPAWEEVGVTFSDHVHAYETMKIRILNGGHQVICNVGEVLGLNTIAECMAHPQVGALFRKVASQEIVPHVKPVPDMTPEAYVDLIETRFANPRILDTVRRVAFDGSSRHAGFLLPTIREAIAKGTPYQGLALVEAAWARMCAGTREDGSQIEPNDPYWADLSKVANEAKSRPQAWLEMRQFYGDLADHQEFSAAFDTWLSLMWSKGMGAALDAYLGQ